MFENGVGKDSEFSRFNPLVNFIYFLLVIIMAIFANRPEYIGAALIMSAVMTLRLKGYKGAKGDIKLCMFMSIFMVLINGFFTHNGMTILFYLGENPITLEAFAFGLAAALMLCVMVLWFACLGVVLTGEKFVYLFGRAMPVLSLTISMIFRFIPLLKNRYKEIHDGQRCMGRGMDNLPGPFAKIRQLSLEISILVSWSLETSIETSDSMEARGYGLKGRTSFYLFTFKRRDFLMLVLIIGLAILPIITLINGDSSVLYYPEVDIPPMTALAKGALISYIALMLVPLAVDAVGEVRWKRSSLKM